MLVLGRKTDESLILDGEIIITILGIEGDRVKVGIEAPKHITILRSEVRDRQRQHTNASDEGLPVSRR